MKFTLVVPVAPERDAEIIKSIKKLNYPRSEFHVVVAVGKNPSINRNKGAKKARGEYIVFLDDDAIINPDYLEKISYFIKKHPEIDVVGGPQLTPHDDERFAKISGYALGGKFGAYKVSGRYSAGKEILNVDETALTSANLVCKRKVLEVVQFDPNLFPGEDPKFIADIKKYGFRVGYSPEIIIYHRRRPTIGSFLKQFFRYGLVRPAKESFVETLKKPFFFIPSVFSIYLVALIISVIINPGIITGSIFGFWGFVPFFAYIVLALVFSAIDSFRNKDFRAFFVLPAIYLMIHLSYGIGMIGGYLKKLKVIKNVGKV